MERIIDINDKDLQLVMEGDLKKNIDIVKEKAQKLLDLVGSKTTSYNLENNKEIQKITNGIPNTLCNIRIERKDKKQVCTEMSINYTLQIGVNEASLYNQKVLTLAEIKKWRRTSEEEIGIRVQAYPLMEFDNINKYFNRNGINPDLFWNTFPYEIGKNRTLEEFLELDAEGLENSLIKNITRDLTEENNMRDNLFCLGSVFSSFTAKDYLLPKDEFLRKANKVQIPAVIYHGIKSREAADKKDDELNKEYTQCFTLRSDSNLHSEKAWGEASYGLHIEIRDSIRQSRYRIHGTLLNIYNDYKLSLSDIAKDTSGYKHETIVAELLKLDSFRKAHDEAKKGGGCVFIIDYIEDTNCYFSEGSFNNLENAYEIKKRLVDDLYQCLSEMKDDIFPGGLNNIESHIMEVLGVGFYGEKEALDDMKVPVLNTPNKDGKAVGYVDFSEYGRIFWEKYKITGTDQKMISAAIE